MKETGTQGINCRLNWIYFIEKLTPTEVYQQTHRKSISQENIGSIHDIVLLFF